jgi:hypothetical protein
MSLGCVRYICSKQIIKGSPNVCCAQTLIRQVDAVPLSFKIATIYNNVSCMSVSKSTAYLHFMSSVIAWDESCRLVYPSRTAAYMRLAG